MIVLVAHGTRNPAGPRVIAELASLVQAEAGVPVRVAYADVLQPDVTSVLRSVRGPAVVIPAFLASGYHVRTDIPAQIAASGRRDVVLTDAFGPAPELIEAMRDRLVAAGYRRGDAVVLAAAGSSDPRALAEVRSAARALSAALAVPVRIGYAATARPTASEAVQAVGGRVAVASWLLAPGLFQQRLEAAGADVVAEPLGAHPGVVDLVLRRYRQAAYSMAA
ncbi:sirohydrochlorin chelatase [Amycolatopsis sp. GM8]|uniref:sirohydrochlorin chelatase n=1 Tax=Amycolatopsis sp. GM8 TaxID=2896530 RepID=UPI001F3FDFB8|nr:sirohydrochlorin chelatase [Amycolatopsis sp. GM8]